MTQQNEKASTELIAKVLAGDASARRVLSAEVDPIVSFQTDRFCRRYCHQNKYNAQCTLKPPEGPKRDDAPLCDWANASYGWMLGELTNEKRLQAFEGKPGSPFEHYVRVIINSLPFYERWKDWRFGRRVHVPEFIIELDPAAKKVFLALRNGDSISVLAQKVGLSETDAKRIADAVITTLVAKKKLHLLDPPATSHFSELAGEDESEFEAVDSAPGQESLLANTQMQHAFQQLDVVEQFVLEAMVIEEQDAEDVLNALARLDIVIKKGVKPADTNRQQLYYFKRKCLAKLNEVLHGAS